MTSKKKYGPLKSKGFLWMTLLFFLVSILLHWFFGWKVFVNEQAAHGQAIVTSDYIMEMMRDTMENWQSEFLQLMWQVAGLAYLLYVGSPQSKEGDERKEEKIDFIIRNLDPKNADNFLKKLEEKYPQE